MVNKKSLKVSTKKAKPDKPPTQGRTILSILVISRGHLSRFELITLNDEINRQLVDLELRGPSWLRRVVMPHD